MIGERTIRIPAGCVLEDQEIVKILTAADAEKRKGELSIGFMDVPEGYRILVPVTAKIEKDELVIAITRLNDAKEHGYADVTFTFDGGEMVKKGWILVKDKPSGGRRRLTVGGARKQEF